MAQNYDRFLYILSKWPVHKSRGILDYGTYLRELLKKKDAYGNVFPGDVVENSKKLDSLVRLINNTYRDKYPFKQTKGGTGLDIKSLETLLDCEELRKKPKFFKWVKISK